MRVKNLKQLRQRKAFLEERLKLRSDSLGLKAQETRLTLFKVVFQLLVRF